MKIPDKVIKAAYERHAIVYGKGKAWDIPHHVDLWMKAKNAFEQESFEDFNYIYEALKSYWQVFRAAQPKKRKSAEEIYQVLQSLDCNFAKMKLSDMEMNHLEPLWALLVNTVDIKQNKNGPSLVAISKFLHFWNPRLFVIVDKARIWNYVFEHQWIKEQIEDTAETVKLRLPESICENPNFKNCDFGQYPAVLLWCSRLMRDNPNISSLFYEYLCDKCSEPIPQTYLKSYEAPAVEWLLLGLVEIPPFEIND